MKESATSRSARPEGIDFETCRQRMHSRVHQQHCGTSLAPATHRIAIRFSSESPICAGLPDGRPQPAQQPQPKNKLPSTDGKGGAAPLHRPNPNRSASVSDSTDHYPDWQNAKAHVQSTLGTACRSIFWILEFLETSFINAGTRRWLEHFSSGSRGSAGVGDSAIPEQMAIPPSYI